MKPERWKQIDEILEAAIEIGPAHRDAFLNEACAGDQELCREVKSLLSAHDNAEDFIKASPAEAAFELIEASMSRQVDPDIKRPIDKSRAGRKTALLILAFASIALLALAAYKLVNRDEPAKESSKIVLITQSGNALKATISSDGSRVAYVTGDKQQSLWVRNLAASSDAEIIPPAPVDYSALMFSADGQYVYFVRSDDFRAAPEQLVYEASLYKVPVSGGEQKELIRGAREPFAVSADGNRLAFARLSARGTAIVIADKDGSAQKTFFELNRPDRLSHLAWSRDEKSVTCSIEGSGDAKLIEINIESSEQMPISSQAWEKISGLSRLSDGRLVIAARSAQSESTQLWLISSTESEAQRITDDLKDYSSPARGGDSLVAIQSIISSGIVVSLKGETNPSMHTATESREGVFGISFAAGGKIVYASEKAAESDIWMMDIDSSNRRQLTSSAGINRFPSVSPDGRYIVFVSTRTGNSNVWRMNIDGSQQIQLTDSRLGHLLWPQCSPDGKWVVYASAEQGKTTLWKAPISGGESVQLTDANSLYPAISPDGKLIAFLHDDGENSSIEIMQFEGGRVKTLEPARGRLNVIRWSADSRALTYATTRDGVSNIWIQPVDSIAPRQMTGFKDGLIFWFDWSPDGRWLASSRGAARSDVVLIKR